MTASSVSRNRERQGRESFAGTPGLGRLLQWWTSPLYQVGPLSSATEVPRDARRSIAWGHPAGASEADRTDTAEHLWIVVIDETPAHREGCAGGDAHGSDAFTLAGYGLCSTPTWTRSPIARRVGWGTDAGRVCGERSSDSSFREYREFEPRRRWPTFETWDRICNPYGWPQAFVG
jgi:hypothetical protein